MSGADDGDPWAVDAADVASKHLEVALGSYVGAGHELGGEFSLAEMMLLLLMLLMSGLMGVWFWIVVLVLVLLGVVSTPVLLVLLGLVVCGVTWICFLHCLVVLVRLVGCIVPFLALYRLCNVLRFFGVLVALQGCIRMHVGVDNLNVVRHVSRLIDDRYTGKPFPLVNDGDLFLWFSSLSGGGDLVLLSSLK